MVGASEPVAHKPLGVGSNLLSSKRVSDATRTAACTDSHGQYVRGFVYKSPGRHSLQGSVQAGNESPAMGGLSPLSIRAAHIPGLRNRGADMLLRMEERRWICSPRARTRTARCSSPYLTPRWKGTRWHRAVQQLGCMHFLRSRYCHWCYTRSGRSERQ